MVRIHRVMNALVDPNRIKKIILAKQVGQFLERDQKDEERSAIEGVARMLVADISEHVRSTLAYFVRQAKSLPVDIAERIARDAENIAVPFLKETTVFSDKQLAKLVPSLQESAQVTLACRSDIGKLTVISLAAKGKKASVSYLLKNDSIKLSDTSAKTVAKRFQKNQVLLDALAQKDNLPLSVVKDIINRVSDEIRIHLITVYKIAPKIAQMVTGQTDTEVLLGRLSGASRSQIHGLVVDLRREDRLRMEDVIDFAERGELAYFESALAVCAELTVSQVRDALSLKDEARFRELLKRAEVEDDLFTRAYAVAKTRYQH